MWIKRDDLTGFGAGGNKGRKLEYLMAAALAEAATDIVSCGAAQSNHARQTAAAAAAFGLPCHLLLLGGPATGTGNQTLSAWFGAHMEFLGDITWGRLRAACDEFVERLRAEGRRPYLIPVGGSTPLGALGFVRAALEIEEPFEHIYVASSSGSTQAGLGAGLRLLESPTRLTGVMVDLSREPEPYLAELANGIAALLGAETQFRADDFHCDKQHLGPGYAQPSEEGLEAIRLLARTEGILTDPVYSGKALACLMHDAREGRIGGRVLFWHTGGVPTLFAREYASLS